MALRHKFNALAFGPSFLPRSGAAPCIIHYDFGPGCLPFGYIYVGMSCSDRLASPWLAPTGWDGCLFNSGREYAAARADKSTWLRHLLGKVLVCPCRRSDGCHAEILRSLCITELEAADCDTVPNP